MSRKGIDFDQYDRDDVVFGPSRIYIVREYSSGQKHGTYIGVTEKTTEGIVFRTSNWANKLNADQLLSIVAKLRELNRKG
jgi:hypothetical protein